MEVVAGCLDSIWEDPASRPDLIFYDNACRLRRYRLHHPDDSWLDYNRGLATLAN